MDVDFFIIPDIPFQKYPIYWRDSSGRVSNFKAKVYPNPTSARKYTRNKQLKKRSLQAKMFDMLVNINYFSPFTVIKEMPILIDHRKDKEIGGMFFLLDYYFPNIRLAVELDSDLHDKDKDKLRDEFIKSVYDIDTFRMRDFQTEKTQKGKFQKLIEKLKSINNIPEIKPLIFNRL